MKRLFLVLTMLFVVVSSCDSDNYGRTEGKETSNNSNMNSEVSAKSFSASSVGELHNLYLADLLEYLDSKNDIGASNVDQYIEDYFNTLDDGELATSYYNDIRNDNELDYEFSEEFQNEMQNFDSQLENSDFENIGEFQDFVANYETVYLSDENELIAWSHYKDIFVNSFTYWEQNFDQWENVLNENSIAQKGGYPICDLKPTWWKRTWCNIKVFAGMDAAAGGGKALVSLITGNPVVIGAVATAALGGSVASVVNVILFG